MNKSLFVYGILLILCSTTNGQSLGYLFDYRGYYEGTDGTVLAVNKTYNSANMIEANFIGYSISYGYGGENNWIPNQPIGSLNKQSTQDYGGEIFRLKQLCLSNEEGDCRYMGCVIFSQINNEMIMSIIAIDPSNSKHMYHVREWDETDYIIQNADIVLKYKRIKK